MCIRDSARVITKELILYENKARAPMKSLTGVMFVANNTTTVQLTHKEVSSLVKSYNEATKRRIKKGIRPGTEPPTPIPIINKNGIDYTSPFGISTIIEDSLTDPSFEDREENKRLMSLRPVVYRMLVEGQRKAFAATTDSKGLTLERVVQCYETSDKMPKKPTRTKTTAYHLTSPNAKTLPPEDLAEAIRKEFGPDVRIEEIRRSALSLAEIYPDPDTTLEGELLLHLGAPLEGSSTIVLDSKLVGIVNAIGEVFKESLKTN